MILDVIDAQGRRRQFPLDRPRLLIGREPSCDIHLLHPGVSRRHAQLQRTEQGLWLLQDLSSRNRVYVEGRPIQQIVLAPRQSFRIADYWLQLREPAQEIKPEEEFSVQQDTLDLGSGLDAALLENLQVFGRTLLTLDEPPQILENLAREVQRIFSPKVLAVGLNTPGDYAWEVVLTQDRGVLTGSLQDADAKVAEDQSSVQSWTGRDASNPLCVLVPMKGRHGILGHIYLAGPNQPTLSKAMQRYLGLLASYAGLAWDNLHLGRWRQMQLEMEKELQNARQIQIDLFPPTFDIDPRLDAFGVNLPSAKVSGDYYDLLRTGPDAVAFVIADAMGHGLPAALLMAAVRAGLRMGLSLHLPWDTVFRGLDDLIRQARADTFVTGMIGLLDLPKKDLLLVSAGHPPPSILVDGQPVEVPSRCLTRPWGIDLESHWEVGHLSLQGRRWSILCFTDGVTETAVHPRPAFGNQRVADYHRANFHLSAEDLSQGLLNEVAAQHASASLGDDQTLLVLCSR